VETTVGSYLSTGLANLTSIQRRTGVGVDGSTRRPDDARALRDDARGTLDVAIEYKLYRTRKQAAGEMDRALGQCIAYAEQYDAVLFLVVYMARPKHPIPTHWIDRSAPLRVGHKQPGVPIYFAARPRHWSEPWSSQFKR